MFLSTDFLKTYHDLYFAKKAGKKMRVTDFVLAGAWPEKHPKSEKN